MLFSVSAAISIIIATEGFFLFGALSGVFIVLVGIGKLEQDTKMKEFAKTVEVVDDKLYSLIRNVERGYNFAEKSNRKSEKRIQRLDAKRIESDKKTEKMFRDLVRKLIELENNMNKLSKIVVEKRK